MIGSTVLSGVGQIYSANASAAASEYSAKVNEQNAKYAEERARDALLRGAEEEQRVRAEGAQVSRSDRRQRVSTWVRQPT